MHEPELHTDETVIFRTPDVIVKSIPFEAVLTNKRLILIDRKKNLIPPKDIVLKTIQDVEPGENAIRDPTLTLSVTTGSGEMRQMILTFVRFGGGGRIRERDDWARELKKITETSARTTPPSSDRDFGKTIQTTPAPTGGGFFKRSRTGKETLGKLPIEKIGERGDEPQERGEPVVHPRGFFCSRCGNRLPHGSVFCTRCGAKVVAPAEMVGEQEQDEPFLPEPSRAHDHDISVKVPGRKTIGKKVAGRGAKAVNDNGFFSRFFAGKASSKIRRKAPAVPGGDPVAQRPLSGGPRGRHIIAIAGIAVLAVALAGAVFFSLNYLKGGLPGTEATPDVTGTPSPTPAGTVRPVAPSTPIAIRTEPTPITVPSDGVYVRVSYIGSWRGSYGITGALLTAARSGDVVLNVENATGTVQASFRKDDTSTRPHELSVEIYKYGTLIGRGVTTEPKGQVDISVNLATATPITVATTAAGAPVPTTPAGNATPVPTTIPPTMATTSP